MHLQDLNLSGNQLACMPDGIGSWTDIRKLSVHGNQLQQLPQQGWEELQQLDEVCVQGNRLTALPDGLAKLGVSRTQGVWGRARARVWAGPGKGRHTNWRPAGKPQLMCRQHCGTADPGEQG